MRESKVSVKDGNLAVMVAGALMMLMAYRPFIKAFNHFVPTCIQIGTGLGIGLLTCLAGFVEIAVVMRGKYTILMSGFDFSENYISVLGILIIFMFLHHHINGGFAWAMIICTILAWAVGPTLLPPPLPPAPNEILTVDVSPFASDLDAAIYHGTLALKLFLLCLISLNGLMRSFSDLAHLTVEKQVPRGRWMYVMCGVSTIISGALGKL
jgi:xanthine/uracil/vitamin C permease (AzgA family)